MWQEYAVQPECLAQSWPSFRALFFAFGWEHGRLLAKYPAKDWVSMVHEKLARAELSGELKPIARASIEHRLATEKWRLVNAGRPYDQTHSWLTNAEDVQATKNRFHAVVSMVNPRTHKDVLLGEELDDQTPLWCCESARAIPRTAWAMAEAVAPLLVRAELVLLIDPHFDGQAGRFLNLLKAVLARISPDNTQRADRKIRVEYHTESPLSAAEFERATTLAVEGIDSKSTSVDFFLWRQRENGEQLHDRFVLTELGGVMFSVGLDTGKLGETTSVTRLSRTLRKKTWANYSESTAAFDLVHKFSIGS